MCRVLRALAVSLHPRKPRENLAAVPTVWVPIPRLAGVRLFTGAWPINEGPGIQTRVRLTPIPTPSHPVAERLDACHPPGRLSGYTLLS